jgi:hypothetical protein
LAVPAARSAWQEESAAPAPGALLAPVASELEALSPQTALTDPEPLLAAASEEEPGSVAIGSAAVSVGLGAPPVSAESPVAAAPAARAGAATPVARASAVRARRTSAVVPVPRKATASAALDLDELPDDLDVPENPDEVRELRELARAERSASTSPASTAASEPAAVSSATPAPASAVAAPAPSAPAKPRTRAKVDPALQKALAEAEALRERNELSALAAFRRLGREYPKEPRVLEGWSRIAASTKWWGESLRVAEAWAALDSSAPAQIHLARTQKRLGQVERAIATLQTLLAKQPREREASNLLQLYGGASVALR